MSMAFSVGDNNIINLHGRLLGIFDQVIQYGLCMCKDKWCLTNTPWVFVYVYICEYYRRNTSRYFILLSRYISDWTGTCVMHDLLTLANHMMVHPTCH